MQSLAHCLKTTGKELSAADKRAIIVSAGKYKAGGMSTHIANLSAIEDMLDGILSAEGKNAWADTKTGSKAKRAGGESKGTTKYQVSEPTGKTSTTPHPITKQDIESAFPGEKVTDNGNGEFTVKLPDGELKIKAVDRIAIDKVAFKIAYKRPWKGETASGKYKNGTITIAKVGDRWTLEHEKAHHLERAGYYSPVDIALLNRKLKSKGLAITEENRAQLVTDAISSRTNAKGIERVIRKVLDLIDAFVRLFKNTYGGLIKDIESGKILDSKVGDGTAKMTREAFSLGKATGSFDTHKYRPEIVSWAKDKFGDKKAEDGSTVWENFVEWFGDSKVVDESGKPLVVYHYSPYQFTVFDMGGTEGSHFGTMSAAVDRARGANRIDYEIEKDAEGYFVYADNGPAEGEGQGPFRTKPDAERFVSRQPKQIEPMAVYIKLSNPIKMDDAGVWTAQGILDKAKKIGVINNSEYESSMDSDDRYKAMRGLMLAKGIDGVEYINTEEDPGSTSYIVFSPTQIKSIFNKGAFDAGNPDIRYQIAEEYSPKKTVKAYKLFRTLKTKPGKIFPLFIGKTKDTPIGKWLVAGNIKTKGYAHRPGWHAGQLPIAPHLRGKDNRIQGGRVWAEVELPADRDWQSVADKSKTKDIRGDIPANGHYRFKTNKMQGGAWIIGGALKIKRLLSDKDVGNILRTAGYPDNEVSAEQHSSRPPDIRYQTTQKRQTAYQTVAQELDATIDAFETLKKKKRFKINYVKSKKDFSAFDTTFSTLLYHAKKIPAALGMYNASQDKDMRMYNMQQKIETSAGGENMPHWLGQFSKKQKVAAKALKKFIFESDINKEGYSVDVVKKSGDVIVRDRKNNMVALFTLDGNTQNGIDISEKNGKWIVKGRDGEVFEFEEKKDALEKAGWEFAIAQEADTVSKTLGEDAGKAIYYYRRLAHNDIDAKQEIIREWAKGYTDRGEEPPTIAVRGDNGKVNVSISAALHEMGSLRGFYMPRLRPQGRLVLRATKSGKSHNYRYHFDAGFEDTEGKSWKELLQKATPIYRKARELADKGYSISIEKSTQLPQDVFIKYAGQHIAMEAILNKALEKIRNKNLGVEAFGLKGKAETRNYKKVFVVTGTTTLVSSKALITAGGKYGFITTASGGHPEWVFPLEKSAKEFNKDLAETLLGLEDMNPSSDLMFGETVATMLSDTLKGFGARSRQIRRGDEKGTDVWLGYEEDPFMAMTSAAHSTASALAKKDMATELLAHFSGRIDDTRSFADWKKAHPDKKEYTAYKDAIKAKRIDPGQSPRAYKAMSLFMEHMLRNSEISDRVIAQVKAASVFKYLAFRPAAAVVNLTALVTTVIASMKASGIPITKSFFYLGKASNDYAKYKNIRKGKLDADTRAVFEAIEANGWDKALFNIEALEVLKNKPGVVWGKALEYGMWMFGKTEQFNRAATIAAAYAGIKAKDNGQWTDAKREAAIKKAHDISDNAHGVYNRGNWVHLAQGNHLAAHTLQSFMVFKTFAHNYMLNALKMGMDKQYQALAWHLLSPAAIAGTGASVLTPAAALVFKGLGKDDPEEEFYEWLEKQYGLGEWARLGAVGLGGRGVSMKGSLAIGIGDLPTSIGDILGAPGSILSEIKDSTKNAFHGDYRKAFEKAMPNAIAGLSKAHREYTAGVTSRSNTPVFYGGKQLKNTMPDAILRAFTFNSARRAGIGERQWKAKLLERKYQEWRSNIYRKMKKAYTNRWVERGEWLNVMNEVKEYNAVVKRKRLALKGIKPITRAKIKSAMTRALKPSRLERKRGVYLK